MGARSIAIQQDGKLLMRGFGSMATDLDTGIQITLTDRNAETSVFLHSSGDHIVIRYSDDGYQAVLPHGSFAWDRAVRRAMIGSVFL
jgi:hypothetical protein